MPEQSDELAALFDYTRWGAEIRTALAQTMNGVFLRGARVQPVATHPASGAGPAVTGGQQLVSSSAGRLVGWNFCVPTGSAGHIRVDLYDGTDNTGTLIASLEVAVGAHHSFEHHGIGFVHGLYVDILGPGADAARGAVWLGATE